MAISIVLLVGTGSSITAKGTQKLIVEAKGAKASDNSKTKKNAYFNSTQIKVHYGRAIIKVLEQRQLHTDGIIAIAHPDNEYIRKVIGGLVPTLKPLGIIHYWVSEDGGIIEE